MKRTRNICRTAKILLSALIVTAVWLALGSAPAVLAADEDISLTPQNGIPLLIIRVDETGDNATVEEMNESYDHSVRCTGTVQIIVPEGYTSEYGGTTPERQIVLEYVRGRGNSTWQTHKKPYKIKFAGKNAADEDHLAGKQDLFGMGEDREWGLMANAFDSTLIKNRVTSWLGQKLSFDFTPQMVPVDLVMIGIGEDGEKASYLGSYTLSELVDVGKNRVNIREIDKNVAAEPDITGGYMLSFYNDMQNDTDASAHFITNSGVDMIIEAPEYEGTPDELSPEQKAQREYIINYIQTLEDLIVKPETIDEETHNKIAAMMDLDSAVDYWWVQEFTMNGDAYLTDSSFMYKERSDRLFWGPLWDFDAAFGGRDETLPVYSKHDGFNNTEMLWLDKLRSNDPLFAELLTERWNNVIDAKLEELLKDNGVIDRYYEQMRASQAADYAVWSPVYDDEDYGAEDYQEAVGKLKNWMTARREWINGNLDKIRDVYITVRFKIKGEYAEGADKVFRAGTSIGDYDAPKAPHIEGYVFLGWVEEESTDSIEGYVVNEDTVFTAAYIPEESAVAPTGLYFSSYEEWVPLSQQQTSVGRYEVLPEDTTDPYMTWSSSDESVVSIDDENMLHLLRTGDVTVTGTLYNGISNSYTLHVYDPDNTEVQTVREVVPEKAELTIKTGETIQLRYSLKPEGTVLSVGYIGYQISDPGDEGIIGLTSTGAVTGLKPGTVEVVLSVDPDYSLTPFDETEAEALVKTATFRVRVTNGSETPAKPTSPYIIIPGDEPTDPTEPTDVEPTDPTKPTDVKPTDPTKPTDVEPTEPTKPVEPAEITIKRLGGDDRFGTANRISAEGWESAETVVIAAGSNYPDALAGAVLAKKLNGPILLAGANGLDQETIKEIGRLGAKNAVILGGKAAVGEGVEKTLREKNINVTRIAGATRNDTAALIAYKFADNGNSTAAAGAEGKTDTIILVSNAGFADALSVSPAAALRAEPILYINSDGTLPAATKEAVDRLGVKNARIIGGPAAIGTSAEAALNELGVASTRVYGATRYDTAVAVYDTFKDVYASGSAAVATGRNFPDALAGGAFSARKGTPIFLVDDAPAAGLASRLEGFDTLYVFGGTAAVPDSVVDMLVK